MSRTCVILVSYRGAADTAACVRSLLASDAQVEIVVVDTTPNDALLAEALAFAPSVVLLRAPSNLGFGGGNNLGLRWAAVHRPLEFIFLLNNDTVIFPSTIARLEEGMDAHPGVGILTPRIAYLDHPERLWYGGGEVDWRRAGVVAPGFNRNADAPLALAERDVSFASGCALFIRSSAMRLLGGFDARFFLYEEDVDLCLRARKLGIRIHYLPQSLLLHKAQGSSRNDQQERHDFFDPANPSLDLLCYHVFRNRLLNLLLHARGGDLCTALAWFPILLLRRMVPLMCAGRWDAVCATLRGLRDAWPARHAGDGLGWLRTEHVASQRSRV
jgi:GT2 family glycosyltransferase